MNMSVTKTTYNTLYNLITIQPLPRFVYQMSIIQICLLDVHYSDPSRRQFDKIKLGKQKTGSNCPLCLMHFCSSQFVIVHLITMLTASLKFRRRIMNWEDLFNIQTPPQKKTTKFNIYVTEGRLLCQRVQFRIKLRLLFLFREVGQWCR